MADSLEGLTGEIAGCRACPRLVAWREEVAANPRAAFADETYWGRPVPGWGDAGARVVVAGLAPAAHGANRTGRIFTGDRSGDWLFGALWRTGFANQAEATAIDDGLALTGAYLTSPVRCAPPENKPTPEETRQCAPFMGRELALLTEARVYVALGAFGWKALCLALGVRPRPAFGHGLEVALGEGHWLLGSYHPSQRNTFTGRLTEEMLDGVFLRARELAGLDPLRG